ncbi:hypothetical protein VPH35_065793 [Triticum aestivum]
MSKTPAAQARASAGGSGRSETPPRLRAPSQDRGRTRRRGDVPTQTMVQPAPSSGALPMLTRTNYAEWALLMKVYLQAHGWWGAVSHGDVTYHNERNAMITILRGLPSDVLLAVGEKETAKEAWDAIALQRLGATRVREANAQKLRRDFEGITFRDGETIDDFSLRLSGIVAGLRALGDIVEESKVVAKFLRVVPPQFAQVAIAIETLLDISTLSLDEVTGRLRVVQDRLDDAQGANSSQGGRLLLTREEWQASELQPRASGGNNNRRKGGGRGRGRGRGGGRGAGRGTDYPDKSGGDKEKCRYCGIKGHWARECRRKKREEEALLAQADEEADPQMLFAEVVELAHPIQTESPVDVRRDPPRVVVFLNEEQSSVAPAAGDAAPDPVWYLDSGASNHMTGDRTAFAELDNAITGSVRFGDGSVVQIEGRGTVAFGTKRGAQRALTDVYYIPRLKSSVVSLGQLDENGCDINVHHGILSVHDRRGNLIIKVKRSSNRLYKLHIHPVRPVCLGARTDNVSWRWHARFGHLHIDALQRMARGGMVRGLPGIEHSGELCQACLAGKQRRAPFPQTAKYRAEASLDLIHADLCGAITPATPGGRRYFLLLVDDHNRYMWLNLLTSKDEAATTIKEFQARVEIEARRRLGTLRTDRRGEFTSTALAKHFASIGVQRHLTAPYSPQQNGVVERRNQTVVGMARSMMKAKGMPDYFWGEAVTTAVYLLNRAFTRSVDGATPYEAWHGRKPEVSHLRVFGCVAHVKSARPLLKKLDDRSTPMVHIGYEPGSKAYRVYDPATHRVHVSRDVVFDESASWDWSNETAGAGGSFVVDFSAYGGPLEDVVTPARISAPPSPEPATGAAGENTPASPHSGPDVGAPLSPAAGGASAATPVWHDVQFATPPPHDADMFDDADDPDAVHRFRRLDDVVNLAAAQGGRTEHLLLLPEGEPATFAEAEPHAAWRAAMTEEMACIESNETWSLCDLPAGHRPIGLKWVFKEKRNAAGEVIKHKARLVAKGFVQRAGIDFEEIFAPVARLDSMRVLLAAAAQEGWEVHHLDVKSAFLNGELEEEVYVVQPPGFEHAGARSKVLRLHKALYGLRQAPRAWYAKLDSSLNALGFERCPSEHAVYTRAGHGGRLLVGVYVDDLIVTGASTTAIAEFKKEMMALFKMSDLGLLSYYLGIEVDQRPGQIIIAQSAYAGKLLEKAGMADCHPVATPMQQRLKLRREGAGEPVDATYYRSVVGSLRYLTHTRPDITYAVGYVSRFMEAPTSEHWAAVKQLLRYIAGTRQLGCRYARQEHGAELVGYSDSDLGGDLDDRKSTSGTIFFLGGSPVSWQSAKQKIVALSSCEAEYVAAAGAACQGIWLRRLIGELLGRDDGATRLCIDNKSAIALSKNPVFHDRSKHIELRYHFIRQCVEDGSIDVQYVRTGDQLADFLTKALGRTQFQEMRDRVGIVKYKPT